MSVAAQHDLPRVSCHAEHPKDDMMFVFATKYQGHKMVARCELNHRFMSIKKPGTVMWPTKNPSGEDYPGDERGHRTSKAAVLGPGYSLDDCRVADLSSETAASGKDYSNAPHSF